MDLCSYLPPLLILKDFSFSFLKVFSVKLNSRQKNYSRILALDMVHFFSLSRETKPSDLYGFKRLRKSIEKVSSLSIQNLLWFYRIISTKTITHNELNSSKLLYENSQAGPSIITLSAKSLVAQSEAKLGGPGEHSPLALEKFHLQQLISLISIIIFLLSPTPFFPQIFEFGLSQCRIYT